MLPGGSRIHCKKAMYAPEAPRSLISYRDLRANGIHAQTCVKDSQEALQLWKGQLVIATIHASPSGLFELRTVSPHRETARSENISESFSSTICTANIWHHRLGHPGTTMMRRQIPITTNHGLSTREAERVAQCEACIAGKLVRQASKWKLPTEMPPPLLDYMEIGVVR